MPAKKGATKKVEKRTLVVVPADLHRALKMHAAEHGTQVKVIVATAIRKHLGIKEGGGSSKK